MLYSGLLPMLYAAGALAGPVINQRNLPKGVAHHQHNHMDFHAHKARQDTPAEQLMAELQSLPGAAGSLPAAPPAAQPAPAPAPVPAEKDVVVKQAPEVVVTVTATQGSGAAQSSPPAAPPANAGSVPVVHEKISGPAVQQKGQKQPAAAPASSPVSQSKSSSDSGNGMPSAPTDYDASLTSEDQAYKDLVLVHHNIHRANHSLPALVWNETLYQSAQNSAQSCVYAHTSPVPPYGQNIAAGNSPGNVSADITNGFYNGEIDLFKQAIGDYGNNSPDMADFEHWGHATQMLWKETTSVGCYTASCAPPGADPLSCGPEGSYLKGVTCGSDGVVGTRAFFLVCDYYPPGNYPNQYSSVPAPVGSKPFVQMTQNGVTGL